MYDKHTQAMVDFALSKIGCGYIYGATGWVCSKSRREQQAAQYPEYASMILGAGAKWDGKECFDCAQLTKKTVAAGGGSLPDGATSQWTKGVWAGKGAIASMPDKPCILYRQSGGVMQHAGVYIGDGWVVDARGTNEGVMKARIGQYGWTHWAMPALASQEEVESVKVPYVAEVVTRLGGGIGLWADNTKEVRVASLPEGERVEVTGQADALGFVPAWAEGKAGVADTQYLRFVRSLGEERDAQPLARGDGGVLLDAGEAERILRLLEEAQGIVRARIGAVG